VAVECRPPIEIQRQAPSLFSTYEDSAFAYLSGCNPLSDAQTGTQQFTAILPDSVYIHQRASATMDGEHTQFGHAKSDAAIVFRVGAGRRYSYRIWGTLYTFNHSAGTAIAAFRLSRLAAAGDSIIASRHLQAGPGPPRELA
jgi:hypothetical protein